MTTTTSRWRRRERGAGIVQQARIQGAAAEYRKEGGSWWCTRHRAVGREKKQMAPSCCRASSSPRLSALIAACAPGYTPATTRYAQKESSCFCSRNASSPEISPSRWRFPAPAPARDERRGASPIQPATSSKTGSARSRPPATAFSHSATRIGQELLLT